MRRFLAFVALTAAVTSGCETHVRRGSTLYGDGRYVEAAEVFEQTEYRLTGYTPRERAEYGLYRGMTLLVLGDLASARRWLTYAYEVERVAPGSLRIDRRALLDQGLVRARSAPACGIRVGPVGGRHRPGPPAARAAALSAGRAGARARADAGCRADT